MHYTKDKWFSLLFKYLCFVVSYLPKYDVIMKGKTRFRNNTIDFYVATGRLNILDFPNEEANVY